MTFPDGSLLRIPAGTIFFVADGRRHGIPDPTTLTILGLANDRAQNITDAELGQVPAGSDYPRLTGALVRNDSGTIFAFEHGLKRGFPDLPTLRAFQQDHSLTDADMTQVSDAVAAQIPAGAAFPHKDPTQDFCFCAVSSSGQVDAAVAFRVSARSLSEAQRSANAQAQAAGFSLAVRTDCP